MGNLIQPGHLFSQHSLNTYLRCRRRFLLKYIDQQPWPVPEDPDPWAYQRYLMRGRVLHQWLERQQLGINVETIVEHTTDQELKSWWYKTRLFDRSRLPQQIQLAELPVVVPLGPFRLYARYDLLAIDPGERAVIVDWKTLSAVPSYRTLAERVQTRVYLYTLVLAGEVITQGTPIPPEQASMLYWFVSQPTRTFEIAYDRDKHAENGEWLRQLVDEIASLERDDFPPTNDARRCLRCNYRTLCGRERSIDIEPSPEDWADEDLDFQLDLESLQGLDLEP